MNTETQNTPKPLTSQDLETLKSGKATITNALPYFGEETTSVICEVEGLSRAIFLSASQVARSIKPILGDSLLREDTLMCLQGSTVTWKSYTIQEAGKSYTRFNGEKFIAEVDGRLSLEDKGLTPNYLLALPFKPLMSSMTGAVMYSPEIESIGMLKPIPVGAGEEMQEEVFEEEDN